MTNASRPQQAAEFKTLLDELIWRARLAAMIGKERTYEEILGRHNAVVVARRAIESWVSERVLSAAEANVLINSFHTDAVNFSFSAPNLLAKLHRWSTGRC